MQQATVEPARRDGRAAGDAPARARDGGRDRRRDAAGVDDRLPGGRRLRCRAARPWHDQRHRDGRGRRGRRRRGLGRRRRDLAGRRAAAQLDLLLDPGSAGSANVRSARGRRLGQPRDRRPPGSRSRSTRLRRPTARAPSGPPPRCQGRSTPTTGLRSKLGVKFRTDVDGSIDGIRFYKSAANTGTHVGNLWTNGGTPLGSATFTGETASGWQEVTFGDPGRDHRGHHLRRLRVHAGRALLRQRRLLHVPRASTTRRCRPSRTASTARTACTLQRHAAPSRPRPSNRATTGWTWSSTPTSAPDVTPPLVTGHHARETARRGGRRPAPT